MSLFRRSDTDQVRPTSALDVFDGLPKGAVKFLWAHQKEILQGFSKLDPSIKDLAIELPTGCGKTLIGLLIAEFLRRSQGSTVLYLCPTKQLANQVRAQADEYRIPTSLLVGKKSDFDAGDFVAYESGARPAISTYHGLFNVNPAFSGPDVIICDDAHSADSAVASNWSLEISRQDHPKLFLAVITHLNDALGESLALAIREPANPTVPAGLVELLPQPLYFSKLDGLRAILRACEDDDALKFPWSSLSGHLHGCCIYASTHTVTIRPYIAPTLTHAPFEGARKRLYMSATISPTGDLERLFGVPKIKRLGTEVHVDTGSHLCLFPSLMTDRDEIITTASHSMRRSLVLVPSFRAGEAFEEKYLENCKVLKAKDVERDIDPFLKARLPAALVLANRYDGLDLKGDLCRATFFAGIPGVSSLQDRFLFERLGAASVLRDRIRTSIVQGLGRCTRDAGDFAVSYFCGIDLAQWCASKRNTVGLPAVLQEEIAFGLLNSTDTGLLRAKALEDAFLDQSDEWLAERRRLVDEAAKRERAEGAADANLLKAASEEVNHGYQLWAADYKAAFESASRVCDALGGDDLKPYRALWHYFAAASGYAASVEFQDASYEGAFRDHLGRALAVTRGVSWVSRLRRLSKAAIPEATPTTELDLEAIATYLKDLGFVGSAFANTTGEMLALFDDLSAVNVARVLKELGAALGSPRFDLKYSASPDGLWLLGGEAIAFEAKTEESQDKVIPMKDVRQALTHAVVAADKHPALAGCNFETIYLTDQKEVDETAQSACGTLRLFRPLELRKLVDDVYKALATIRSRATSLDPQELLELIDAELKAAGLTRGDITGRLCASLLGDMPTAAA